jgi:hypothetical protein
MHVDRCLLELASDMRTHRRSTVAPWWAVACLAAVGCAPAARIVPLVKEAGASFPSAMGSAPLEIVTRSTAIPDPLPVRGSDFGYAEVEGALGLSVVAATTPWATEHAGNDVARRGGWSLLVEVTGADAEVDAAGRVVVGLEVRATLRTRSGNAYLGQTQAGCREGGLTEADGSARVAYRCMARIADDLAGWLAGGVRLDPPPEGP